MHELQLREQIIFQEEEDEWCIIATTTTTVLKYNGHVQSVEFSWVWGGNDRTSFISDMRLKIHGVRVHVYEEAVDEDEDESNEQQQQDEEPTTSYQQCDNNNNGKDDQQQQQQHGREQASSSYFQQYVQQIIDHLTLQIEDFQLTLDINKPKETEEEKETMMALMINHV